MKVFAPNKRMNNSKKNDHTFQKKLELANRTVTMMIVASQYTLMLQIHKVLNKILGTNTLWDFALQQS